MELELINLKKTYGTVQALKGINYKFTSGIYGILGSNGAGKSTMINLIRLMVEVFYIVRIKKKKTY